MEKLQHRPSGGGGKLGTLDMQSYLEVMGRQLAEIQAQHHQFYASRPERYSRAAAVAKEPGQERRVHRSSSAVSPSSARKPDGPTPDARAGTPSSGESGQAGSATVARRSLAFEDGITDVKELGNKPKGRNAKSDGHGLLRMSLSSPPPMSGLSMDEDTVAVSAAPAATTAARPRRQPAAGAGQSLLAQAQSQASRARARTPPRASPPGVSPRQQSASTTGVSPSLSPSSVGASFRPGNSNPGTPSSVATSSHLASVAAGLTPRDGTPPASARARAVADSSVESSPALSRGLGLGGGGGGYAVYNAEAGGISSVIGYETTPESQAGAAAGQPPGSRRPPSASSISTSQSRSAWTTPREGPVAAPAATGPGPAGASPSTATPSSVVTSALTASAMSSALAVHNEYSARVRASGAAARARAGDEGTVSEEDGLPHPLALAGRAFDGIDSEEDDEEDGMEDAVSRPEQTAAAASAAATQRGHSRGGRQPAASGEYAASLNFAAAGLTEASGPSSERVSGLGAATSSRVPGSRPALAAASMETEEALRALLGSPRPVPAHVSGGLSSSLDGGVPEDVLAALAKTDAGGLDAALAGLVRQHAAYLGVHGPAAPSASRPSTQGQGALLSSHTSPGGAAAGLAARHAGLMGPGALTAAPAALPPGVAGRGFDSSLRSAGGAPGASPGGGAAAANAGRGLALHAAAPAMDASISLDQIDQLARTMVIDADTAALMRASVVAAASAMAEQRAAAAAHQQPVLYSMGPTRVSDPGSQALPEPAAAVANAGARPGTATRGPLSPSAASSVGKPGGDGDSVLYGSPYRRGGAAAVVPADGQVPPSIAPSPYVPPSPPPGADPAPYMASPIGHPISRLQHSSRDDEESVASIQVKSTGNRAAGGSEDGGGAPGMTVSVGAAAMAGAVARVGPGSSTTPIGAPDGTHRRHSNTAGGASYDLSLTAAAAVGASRSGLAGSSRAASTTASRAAPQSHAATPTGSAGGGAQPGQPVFSSFSLAGLSPSGANANAAAGAQGARASGGGARMSSYDLGIDEAGRMSSSAASPRPGPSGAGDSALGAGAARTSAQPQPPVGGPPLAAFSRAAAAAAAADVGLAVPPPPAAERRPSQGGVTAATGHSAASMEAAARASAAGAGAGGPREPSANGQNAAGGSSVVSSAAKLSQLKARRQQQWQSQHGVTAADGPQQPHGTPQGTGANASRASAFNHAASDAGGGSHHNTPHVPANSRNRTSAEPGASATAVRGSAASPAPAPAPGPAASPTPLLPEEVANAIVRAASSGVAASGELNLGHGISGLSVAIEAGAVKWAWQTGLKDGGASPGASQASPWASPGAGQAAAAAAIGASSEGAGGKSGDWGVQLPTPQWQRRGVTPPGSRPAVDGADADAELARMEQEALQQRQQQWEAAQQQWETELPGPQYRAPAGAAAGVAAQQQQWRRHTDHCVGVPEGGAAESLAQPTREYATSAGGDAGLQPAGLSADAAGAASSKAAALLRLKRQSIIRHALAGSQAREGEQAGFEPEPEASVAASIHGTNSQRSSRAVSAPIHRASQRAQQQVPDGAPRVAYSRAWEQPEPVPEGDEAGDGEDGGGNQGPAPKPFLRRRSAKVQPKKVDWTHVKPRTNSRNPDYYGDQPEAYGAQYVPQYAQQYAAQLLQPKHVQHLQRISPRGGGAGGGGAGGGDGNADMQAILRQQPQQQAQPQRSPMTSPRGAAKPPLNVNLASRAWRPSGKSPTEDDRSAAAGRRRSNIPPAPAPPYADGGGLGVGAGGGGVSGARAGSAGGGPRGPPGANPLDDLLQHVNTLLKDFDKMVR